MRLRGAALAMCGAAVLAGAAWGQRYTSPPATASVKIGGKQITVEYYAPSMHGRKIFGELVPWGEVWCPGANVATGITTESNLQFGTLKLPKGAWSIWVNPAEKNWTLIVNKQTGQHHLDYNSAEDFGKTKMTLRTLAAPVETLRFEVRPSGAAQGTLALMWETTEASVPFTLLP